MRKKAKSSKKKKGKVTEKQAVTFDFFFQECLRKGVLQPWQDKEILAFFKDKKLTTKEDIKVYSKILKEY